MILMQISMLLSMMLNIGVSNDAIRLQNNGAVVAKDDDIVIDNAVN